ncbi:hypothetical protein K4F52_006137 [Lecanicillium sp. MT-2017a]|nr:hypothetical protein K4F52_006137 [Lecanicillium sp. MT-2017a]
MSLQSAWSCLRPSARQLPSVSRAFTTSAASLSSSNSVPPESPSYINLPTPPQSEEIRPERVRGHLPIPREVFPRAEGDRKVRGDYVDKTAPRRAKERELRSDEARWKTEMADSRRKNLEEGLQALWQRREKRDTARNARVARNFRANQRAAMAPEREDDRLTRSTVLDAMRDTKVYADPERFARAEKSRANVLGREEAKREARQDALRELYISASNFIVTEDDLKAEIDKVFTEDYFRMQSQSISRHGATENVWGVYGAPTSISNMLASTTGTATTRIMDADETEFDRSAKRQKRIAEEFTGGQME